MKEPILRLEAVTRVFQLEGMQLRALGPVSLDVDDGEMLAIMGPSGSGKSTLMNLMGCLDKPTSGKIWIAGEEIGTRSPAELAAIRNRFIGFVFQSFMLLPRTSALENVELPLVYRGGVRAKERAARAKAALERVGLGERLHHHPRQLSGGQQQRVAIARALVNEPRLIFADEPTGALDSKTSVEIMALFQELQASGITVVVVTHEREIADYSNRVIVVRDGRIESDERQAPHLARVAS